MNQPVKNILMIAATPFFSDRGCHIRIYNQLKYLNKNNISVTLCTYHLGYNPPDIPLTKIYRTINIPWYKKIAPYANWHKVYIDFLLLFLVIKKYFQIKPKIVNAHLYEALCAGVFLKILSFGGIKLIFDCQGSLAEEMYQSVLYKKYWLKPFYYVFFFIEKILLYFPDKIFCSSENSYNFLIEKFHIDSKKIDILQDGIDEDIFKPIPEYKKIKIKNRLKIPLTNLVVIYSGSISKSKGVEELLLGLPVILNKRPDITFVFVGYGELESIYIAKYKSWIESHNIVFIGRISYFKVSQYLSIADYAIDPKKDSSESSGKLYNYLCMDLPIICFKNKFNFSVLREKGNYINDFNDICNICKLNNNINKQKYSLIINKNKWQYIILRYISYISQKKIAIDCRGLSIQGGVKTYGLNLIKNLLKIDKNNQYYLIFNQRGNIGLFSAKNCNEYVINFDYPFLYFFWDQVIVPFFCWYYKIDVLHGLKNTVPILSNVKKIVTVHDLIARIYPKSMKWYHSMYWQLVSYIVSKINTKIICVSNSTKKDFIKYYPTKNKIYTIYSGINRIQKEKNLDIKDRKNQILYVGVLEPRKNIPILINSFTKLVEKYNDYKLVIVGKMGWKDKEIDNLILNTSINRNIEITGFISDEKLDNFYKTSKIFVYISQYEGFGFPILEAMSHGLPVITSNNSSLRELGQGSSLLVNENDSEDVFLKMEAIIKNEKLYNELVKSGLNKVKKFSWINTAKKTKLLYEND